MDLALTLVISLLSSSAVSGVVVFWIKTNLELRFKLQFEKQLSEYKQDLEKDLTDFRIDRELYKENQSRYNQENFKIYKELIANISKIRTYCKRAVEYYDSVDDEAMIQENSEFQSNNFSFRESHHFHILKDTSLKDCQKEFFEIVNENQIIFSQELNGLLESFIKIIPFIDRLLNNITDMSKSGPNYNLNRELKVWFNELELNYQKILIMIQDSAY